MGCASLLSAQARKPSAPQAASKLLSIAVTGSKRYTPEQIVAASGLRPGQAVSEDDFKAVSQQLGETGAFSNVAYSFQFSPAGIKLVLEVTDSEPFAPARFDNFVWLSDQDLLNHLRASVPLFLGQLPVAGTLADQVSDALQSLAIERHLKGRADYLRPETADGPAAAFVFTITGQDIRIRQVEFPGAGAAELPALQAAAKGLSGQDFERPALKMQAEKKFLPVYLQRGYLRAAFSDVQPRVTEDTPEETQVDVAIPVSPGLQYKVGEIQLSGVSVFSAEQLRALIRLQSGQLANAVDLDKDLETIKRLYASRGYMAARVTATPQMNDADSTVKYGIQVQEGDVYKMGELEIRGLDSRTTETMTAAWKLREGDIYDADYPHKFTETAIARLPGEGWSVTVHESPENKDKVVDVSLHFEHKQ